MSETATAWAWGQRVKVTSHRLILMALAHLADDDGRCSPSRRTLSNMTGVGVDTVDRAIAELTGAGLISKSARTLDDGSTVSNQYALNLDAGSV